MLHRVKRKHMNGERETQKVCNIADEVTKIRYKIIYRRSSDRYEIWTQFCDEEGKLHRNRITFDEAIAVESDKNKTIAYVNEYLVANHINIYSDDEDNAKRITRRCNQNKPVDTVSVPVRTYLLFGKMFNLKNRMKYGD